MRERIFYCIMSRFPPVGLDKKKQLPYDLPVLNEQAQNQNGISAYTRKAQFHYGWQGGPRLITCGIWRPVSLRAWSKARIVDIHFQPVQINKELASYTAILDIEATKQGAYELTCSVDEQAIGEPVTLNLKTGANQQKINFEISKPDLWWCNGMGTHYLYSFKVQLSYKNKPLTERSAKFGIRKIELVQDSDSFGRSFYFKLNGVPVFAKGATYIPPDVFTNRISGEKYEKLVRSAALANMNMLRIWGGGIYENDTLYELCDKNGIMVWQEFMFASPMQPGDSAHIDNIRQEIKENIKRLRNHPCLALWGGNNEGLVNWYKNGWKNRYSAEIGDKIWNNYENLYYNIIPNALKEYDPLTPYRASSPSSYDNQLPDRKSGDWHDWRVCNGIAPLSAYLSQPSRFVSEYGMQSFSGIKTLHSFDSDENLDLTSLAVNFHQRFQMPWIGPAMNGNHMIRDYIQMYYNDPIDFNAFIYLSQIVQADALKTAIEAHRLNKPRCMGSLFWHLNDCWPAISWSTLDYYCNWKAAHYTVKKSFSNILIVPKLDAETIKVYAINDSIVPLEARLRLRMIDFDGKKIGSHSRLVDLRNDTVEYLWSSDIEQICPPQLLNKACLVAQLTLKDKVLSENILYFTDPKYLDLPIPDITYEIKGTRNHFELLLVTDKLAKNVIIDTNEKEATYSDNNFDLLPGRQISIAVTYPGTLEELENDIKITSLVNTY